MQIAVLSSLHPSFGHARAGNIVLATLVEELGRAGHEVSIFTACCANDPDHATLERLRAVGANHAADLTYLASNEPPRSGVASDLRTLRKAYLPGAGDDYPKFNREAAGHIVASGAQAAILFWDSWLEHLLPEFDGIPVL